MILKCQEATINELKLLSESDRHSILIEGTNGCGKTYMAKEFAKIKDIESFISVQPTVQSIREAVDSCYNIDSSVVLCIENLDSGVSAASYTLLKFLEEPLSHVYIIVTCNNIYRIPDTIISRSATVTMSVPIESDLETYASVIDENRFRSLKSKDVWRAVKTFRDAETVLRFQPPQLDYFESLKETAKFTGTVSEISWKLGHYDDGSETDIQFVIRYLIAVSNDARVKKYGIECIKDLSLARIASHAVLAKFILDMKYGE